MVGDSESVVVEVCERDPGMVGNAKVLNVATVILGLVGVQGDAKMGVGMFDADEEISLHNLNADVEFFLDFAL